MEAMEAKRELEAKLARLKARGEGRHIDKVRVTRELLEHALQELGEGE
jgi:hypothetical protein